MNTACPDYKFCKKDDFVMCKCKQKPAPIEAEAMPEISDSEKDMLKNDSFRGLALYAASKFANKALYDHKEQHWKIYQNGVWAIDESKTFIKKVEDCLLEAVLPLVKEAAKEETEALNEYAKDDPIVKKAKAQKVAILKQKSAIDDPSLMSGRVIRRMSEALGCTVEDFDKDISKICLTNGVYDFDKGKLLPHSPDFRFTKQLSYDYNPSAKCPRWEAFLGLIFREKSDVIKYLQKIFGYCLTGYDSLQSVFFLYGGGENGKSMVINVLKHLVGDDDNGYFYQFDYDQLLTKTHGIDSSKSYTLAKMHGKRVICSSEISGKAILDTAMIKNLTGGDSIQARNPAGRPFNYKPVFKLLMYGNHFPSISENDDGIKRRMKLLKFDFSFKSEGAHLKRDKNEVLAEFIEEASGIFNWAVEGYQLYQKEGIQEPESIKSATDEYFEREDIMSIFINECCVVSPHAQESAMNLYNAIKNWDSTYKIGKITFYKHLQEMGFTKKKTKKGDLFIGIRLSDAIDAIEEDTPAPQVPF